MPRTSLCRKGFVTFSFSYRLSVNEDGTVPHPAITPVESVKDARSALRWLKLEAENWNIDPEKVVAAGQSAGGPLAVSTALLDRINESSEYLEMEKFFGSEFRKYRAETPEFLPFPIRKWFKAI